MIKKTLLGLMFITYGSTHTLPGPWPWERFIQICASMQAEDTTNTLADYLAECSADFLADLVVYGIPVYASLFYLGGSIPEIGNRLVNNRWLNKPLTQHKDGRYTFI